MGEQSQILASLKSIFPESSWPWAISALRHDPLIWNTLADPDFFSRVSSNSVEPRDWSPHQLALLSLDLKDAEHLERSVHEESQAALSQLLESGTYSPEQRQEFKHAAWIALAMFHCFRSDDWSDIKQALNSAVSENNDWLAPMAIAYGFFQDQPRFILDLLENNHGSMILPIVVHVLLCQPIPQSEAQSLLRKVLDEVSLKDAAELLTRLDNYRPELAMRLANDWLEKNPPSINGRSSIGLGDQLQHIMDDLLLSQILTLAGHIDKGEQRKAQSLQFLNSLQVEVANQLVGESLRGKNIEYALSQWTRTANPPQHTPPAGLVVELLRSGRLEDSLSILPDTDRNTQTPLRWLNNIYQALENDDLAQARLFGHQALKSLKDIYIQGAAAYQKAFGSRLDLVKFISELTDRLADLALYREAFQAAQIAVEVKPDDPQALVTLTKTARSAGEYSEAITAAQLAVSLQPTHPEYRRQLAKSFEAAAQWEKALPERQAVLERRFSQPNLPTWPPAEDMLAMANCALQAGDPEQAFEACQKTIEQDPADGQAHAILGEALAALGDDSQAMEHFSLATQLAPHKAAPWLSLANAYQRTGQLEKTIETLRTASHAVPDDPSIFFTLGQVHLAEESPSQALSAMQRAYQLVSEPQVLGAAKKSKKSGPTQVELFARNRAQLCEIAMAYGEILEQLGHQDQAHQVFENAYHAYPAYPDLAYTYAKSILKSGDKETALAPLAIAVASNPPEPQPYIEYARALLRARENPEDAVQALQKALKLLTERNPVRDQASDRDHYLALALLAKAQEAAGQLAPALQSYSQALESPIAADEEWRNDLATGMGRVAIQLDQPEIAIAALQGSNHKEIQDAEVAQILCAAYSAISLTQEALFAARSAVHLAPDDVDVLAWFADQVLSLGVPAEAIPALTSAAQLDPRRTELIIRLAQVQARLGRNEAARDAFLSALSSPYSTPEDLFLAAEGLSSLGEKEAAANCLERALELQPHPPLNLIIELSDAYISAEKLDLAIKTIEKGIELYAENAFLHAYKAGLYQKLGRDEAARSCLEHALILDPEDPALHLQISYTLRDQHELHSALDHALVAVKNINSPLHQKAAIGLAAELSRATLKGDQVQQLLSRKLTVRDAQDGPESVPLDRPDLLDYYCIQAESALELEEQVAAAGALNEAYQLDGGHPRVLALQSRMALRQGDRRSAQETFNSILQINKDGDNGILPNECSPSTFLGTALAAIDLYQWDQADKILEQAVSQFPENSNLQLQRAKLYVMQAEFQRLCQALDITRHAPGDYALSPRSQRLFDEAIQNTINSLSQDMQVQLPPAIERWRNRADVVFNPSEQAIQDLDTLPDNPADQAALITAIAYRGDPSAASRLYHACQNLAGKETLHHSILSAFALALILNGQDQLSNEQALEAVQSAIDQNSSEASYYVIQAKAAEQNQDWALAISAMETALSFWPEESRWHSYYGNILLLNDQFPEAVAHYISAIDMEPEYLQNYLDLSQAYLRIGEPDQSIAILKDAIKQAPDHVEPYLSLASVNYETQNYTEAAKNADLGHRIAPQHVSPLLLRAKIALKLDDPEVAREKVEAALRHEPENPEALHLQAQTLACLGETEQAIQVIDKAITLAPDPLPLHIQKAGLLSSQEGPNDLLVELKSIAQEYPDEAAVLAPLAQAYAAAGQDSEAIHNAQKALQRNGGQLPLDEQVKLHLLLGQLLRQSGQLDLSIHHLSEAIRIAPQSLDSYLELGITQSERRQHDAALETYKKAISIYPADPRPYYQASLLLKASRDYPAAESMLRKAADKAPDDVNIHRQLAALVALNLVHNRNPVTTEINSV